MGGIKAVMRVMKEHKSDLLVQKYACGALSNCALNDENRVGIARLGGIKMVVHAINAHIDCGSDGCCALTSFAENNAKNARSIGAERHYSGGACDEPARRFCA